jgi:hypothetical protein
MAMKEKYYSLPKDFFNDPCEMYEVTFTHIHDTSGFAVSAKYSADGKDHFPPSKHACLRHGYWCWSNAKEDPIMAVRFIWWKICHLIR